MRTTATIIVLTLLTLIGANEIFAQQIISKKYMMQDGLSSNRIYDIVQDSFGFIWVGTDEGLNRFDGTKFQSYYYSETPGAISSNSIRRLLIDRNNKLWVSLDNGIDIYDPSKDTFSHFEVKTKLGETIDTRVLDIIEDGDGEIWIATYGKGLFRYNPKTNTLLVYKNTGKEDDALVFIVDIENDSRGNIWIATYSDGIRCLNKKTGEFRTYKKEYGQNSISDNSIQKIYEDSYGNIWIGTFQNGLDCFDFKTNMFRNYKDNQPKNLLYHIQDIKEYKPGELIIASDNGVGLFRVSDGRFISNNQSYFKIANISNKFVYNIFIDKEESVWLGSYFDGLYFYSDFQNNFEYYASIFRIFIYRASVIFKIVLKIGIKIQTIKVRT